MWVCGLVNIIIHQRHQVGYISFVEYLRAWESDDLGSCNVSKESVSKLGKAI